MHLGVIIKYKTNEHKQGFNIGIDSVTNFLKKFEEYEYGNKVIISKIKCNLLKKDTLRVSFLFII